MRRCWFGAAMLLILLTAGLICGMFLGRLGEELSWEADRAAALADTDRGREILRDVHRRWQKHRFLLTVLSDHEPIREADTLFALLQSSGERECFRENARRLAQLLRDLGQSQLLRWENVL